jgi:hypothetical protein
MADRVPPLLPALTKKGTTAIFREKRGQPPFFENNGGCPLFWCCSPPRPLRTACVQP